MLRQSELKKPLTIIVVLTSVAFLLQGGSLGYQVFSGLTGIDKTQLIYTVCNDAINTILSNSNIFYLVALASAAAGLLCLLVMFLIIVVGMCKWAPPESKYADTAGLNGENALTHQNNESDVVAVGPYDEYFTPCKFILGTVLYLLALLGVLGHFALFLTIFVSFAVCGGVAFISLLVMSILSGISFVLVLICFIKWQIERCKLNQANEQTPNEETPLNQDQNPNQNENMKKQDTRQNLMHETNPNIQTMYPLQTEEAEMKPMPSKLNKSGKREDKSLLTNPSISNNNNNSNKNNQNADYVSFNAKATDKKPLNQSNSQQSQAPMKSSTNNTASKHSADPAPYSKDQPTYTDARNDKPPRLQNKQNSEDQFLNVGTHNSKAQKLSQRNSLEVSSKGEKHPTPKFILSEEEDNQISETENRTQNQSRILQPEPSQKKQAVDPKQTEGRHPKNQTPHQKYSEAEWGQKKGEKQLSKESREEIIKNNGGKPFFKSPPKLKESIPSYERSPLEKYERQDEEIMRSKNKNNEPSRNYPQPQSQPKQTNTKGNQSQQKLAEQHRRFLEQSNASSGTGRGQPHVQRDEQRGKMQRSAETSMKSERKQDEKAAKKTKKTGMLIDYIRSRYAD